MTEYRRPFVVASDRNLGIDNNFALDPRESDRPEKPEKPVYKNLHEADLANYWDESLEDVA